ncbi:MAG: NAD-binding protein [Azonexus sp.]|nr:NAD-binding protein [Azonexus sp.]
MAHELEATGRHYVAIDEDLSRLEEYKERNVVGLLYLHGDASDDDILTAADLEDAKGVLAVTGDDPAACGLLPRRNAEVGEKSSGRGGANSGRLHSQATRYAETAQCQLRAACLARAQRQLAVQSGQGFSPQARFHADYHGQFGRPSGD